MITLLSHWSERLHQFGLQRLKQDVCKTLKVTVYLTLPITLILIVLHRPIVNLAFGRGAFAQERLTEVGLVWVCYLLGFVPLIMGRVYVRAHLTLKNTSIIMRYGFYSMCLKIALNCVLINFFGIYGIALATTSVSVFYVFYLGRTFNKEIKKHALYYS
jgi:putative peptidoglycan lipid II flippase